MEISFSLLCLIPGAGRWLRVFLQPATWPGRRCWPAGFRTESVCMPAGLLSRLDCSTDAAAPAFCSDRSLQRGVQMACSALQIVLLSTARCFIVRSRRHVLARRLQQLALSLHAKQLHIRLWYHPRKPLVFLAQAGPVAQTELRKANNTCRPRRFEPVLPP